MPKISDRISRKEAREALLRSSYLLESRLETVLGDNYYYAEANSAFPDPYTKKFRELDQYALTPSRAGPDESDFSWTNLLIECVNNPHLSIFPLAPTNLTVEARYSEPALLPFPCPGYKRGRQSRSTDRREPRGGL